MKKFLGYFILSLSLLTAPVAAPLLSAAVIQGEIATDQFSPMDLGDKLVQWQHARGPTNFILNGPEGDLVNDDFHTDTDPPTGGTRSGDSHVVQGELVSTTVTGSEDWIRFDVGAHTEMWLEAEITLDVGSVIDETSPFGFDQRAFSGALSTGTKHMMKIRKEGAGSQFSFVHITDAGTVTYTHTPLVVQGQTYKIVYHWKKETGSASGDSEFQAWIDGVQIVQESGYADFAVTTPDDFYVGNWFTAPGSSYTTRVDNLKIGVNGAPPTLVTNWVDRSLKGNDLLQATEVEQPSYDIENNNVFFDGVNDDLATLAYSQSISQPNEIFIAYQFVTADTFDYIFDGITSTDRHSIASGSSLTYSVNCGTTAGSGGVVDTGKYIVTLETNGTSSKFWLNGGTEVNSDNCGTNFLTGLTLAARNTGAQEANIRITEVIVVDGLLTSEEKNQIGRYLSSNNPGFVWADIN